MLGIGRVVGCGCRSGKWVRAEGCYNWQLGGGGPPLISEKVGAGFRFFVGRFGKSEKLAGFRFF